MRLKCGGLGRRGKQAGQPPLPTLIRQPKQRGRHHFDQLDILWKCCRITAFWELSILSEAVEPSYSSRFPNCFGLKIRDQNDF